MDLLTDMLSAVKLTGGVFVDAELRAPFNLMSQIGPKECARFFPSPRHVIAYHYVREGVFACQVVGGEMVTVHAGEIVLLPRNDPHIVFSPDAELPPLDPDAEVEAEGALLKMRMGGEGEPTRVYCGYLGSAVEHDPLLERLPAIMKIRLAPGRDEWMPGSIEFAAAGVARQSPELVGKLSEALLAEAVRRYVAAMSPAVRGWVTGLRDPAIGRALALIHDRYADALTLEALAKEAGLSKTVFAERFRGSIGESPMQYCARWRMKVAADMLRDQRQNACSVAYSVGFNSEAAFNRAFKREFGTPPATWRREAIAA
jgi:AraC-like DNA-binding protein